MVYNSASGLILNFADNLLMLILQTSDALNIRTYGIVWDSNADSGVIFKFLQNLPISKAV